MRVVSLDTFRSDPLYPKIEHVVATILEKDKVVRPIDVLVGMQLLSRDNPQEWRCERIPYLEQVISCNLTRLSRLLRILRFHVHDLKLVPSTTAYRRHGSGPKQRLRFTKTGDAKLEKAYCTHFIWPRARSLWGRGDGVGHGRRIRTQRFSMRLSQVQPRRSLRALPLTSPRRRCMRGRTSRPC
jgi:hypothetical protein